MSIDWKSDEMFAWKKKQAVQFQQNYHDVCSRKCTEYEQSDYIKLKRNIGFAIFGAPKEKPDVTNHFTGYEMKQLSYINRVFGAIMKQNNRAWGTYVSFFYVCVKSEDHDTTAPVIRVHKYDSPSKYDIVIDTVVRVYENWQAYLDENKLPECALCYPKNGMYSAVNGHVDVEFGISPAGQMSAKVLEGLDSAGSVLAAGASCVKIAVMFVSVGSPWLTGARIVSALAGLYAAGRNIQIPVDRATNMRPLGLDDSESRNCWLAIAGCITVPASEGKTITFVENIALNTAAAASCVVSGLGVANGMYNIIKKEKWTPLDIFQFASTVLFFTDSVISANKAFSLLKAIRESAAQGSGHGVNISIDQISNSEGSSKFAEVSGVIVSGLIGCKSMIKKHVGPETIEYICEWACERLSELATQLLQECMDKYQYVAEVVKVVQRFWEQYTEEMCDVITKICKAFGVKHWSHIIVKGYRVLLGSDKGYMKKLCDTVITETKSLINKETTEAVPQQSQVIPESNDSEENKHDLDKACTTLLSDEIFNIHAKFVDIQTCKTAADFYEQMKFVCKFVKEEFVKEKLKYEKMLKIAQKLKPDLNVKDFDKEYGISDNRNNFFLQQVFNRFKDGETEGFVWLKLAYDSQKVVKSTQEESGQSFFNGVTFHTFSNKKGLADNGMLSEGQYYEIARELTKTRADKENVSIKQTGSTAVILVNLSEFVISVQSYPEQGRVSGSVAMLHSPHNSEN